MPAPDEARRGLVLITGEAVKRATRLLTGTPDQARTALLEAAPLIVSAYSDGTSALAADHFDDLREQANPPTRYTAEPVVNLREDKVRTGVLWATGPLYTDDPTPTVERLAAVIQLETARPFRDTITTNRRRDPDAVGWRRVTSGSGCKFCQMLAGRGAVYREDTARFASHPHCSCSAAPVFEGQDGPEASVLQYTASRRKRTAADRKRVRDFLAAMPG
jgi:hypothetical protein